MDAIPATILEPTTASPGAWLDPQRCRVDDLARVILRPSDADRFRNAAEMEQGVPIYDCRALHAELGRPGCRAELMTEWIDVLSRGPGLLVLQGAFDDLAVVDAATIEFEALIEEEKATGAGGDHFARPGANDRVWNALEKLCLRGPDLFARYYANAMIALVSEAWLGPAYQMTSQINCVNPGGAAQTAHRDYHLGFMNADEAARYPRHVHALSSRLSLQGAVAHVDMPLESGPTLYLPHSQKYESGYLVAGKPEFQAFFDANRSQLRLFKGDAVFFNPALMHAAGDNRSTDIRRMANLLQVSSPFGRAMETVNRLRMSKALYPALLSALASGRMTPAEADNAVCACAEGYAFPTNLDRDPPVGGLAPQSQQALMRQAIGERWDAERFEKTAGARARSQQS